jgi:hypothetical protein
MVGDPEVVKRSVRDEPIWVVIHMCMEAMLGISLYSCLKLAKTLCLSITYVFSSNLEKRAEQVLPGSKGVGGKGRGWGPGGRDGPNNI